MFGARQLTFKDIGHLTDVSKLCAIAPGVHDVHDVRLEFLHVLVDVHFDLTFL